MKKEIVSLFFILILAFSCEKIAEQPYTLKYYGDAYEDIGYSVLIAGDGYVIAGQLTDITRREGNFIDRSNADMGIIKTGWDGNTLWKVSAGGKYSDWGSRVYKLSDGSLICVGTFTDTTAATPGNTDVFAVKVSPSGEIVWEKRYGDNQNQTGRDIIETSEGFIILGTTDAGKNIIQDSISNIQGNTDLLFVRINGNGDLLENPIKQWGYPGNETGKAIKSDGKGGYVILGITDRSWPGQGGKNILLVRINSFADIVEAAIYGSKADEYPGDIEISGNDYSVCFNTGDESKDQNAWLARFSNNIFENPVPKNLTINNSTTIYSMCPYVNGTYLVAGKTGSGSNSDLLVFDVDADGNEIAGHRLIKGSTGIQVAYDVTAGEDGYIIAVGKNSYDVNSMISFLKFRF